MEVEIETNDLESLPKSFTTTDVKVFLKNFKEFDDTLIARSQAKSIIEEIASLGNIKTVIIYCYNIRIIGQGFADELFRVWKNHNPKIEISYENANKDVENMIKHVLNANK